ncbi:hypothetical protein GE21DRAFT_1282211 [Neurospora crassa]|nr:hypothetical protein GE21DRAFT_1282211 [Neurospora crassa]
MGHGRWSLSLRFRPDACFAVVTVGSTPPKWKGAAVTTPWVFAGKAHRQAGQRRAGRRKRGGRR